MLVVMKETPDKEASTIKTSQPPLVIPVFQTELDKLLLTA